MTPDAHGIIKALGGRWRGRNGLARCPAHEDSTPSFSVTASLDGFILVHCFAGCPQDRVIAALRARGLWPEGKGDAPVYAPQPSTTSPDFDPIRRRRRAQDLWIKALPAAKTIVQAYLRARGVRSAPPDALRFLPSLKHTPSGRSFPAMIGAVTGPYGEILAIQRTWLLPDGTGKAPVSPDKMTLGPMDNGAVRFGQPLATLGLAEGIETALSAKQMYSLPVWAVLGCNRFETVVIPDDVETIVIFADRGPAGWKAAEAAADRFERMGRAAEIVLPPTLDAKDFNDEIRLRVTA